MKKQFVKTYKGWTDSLIMKEINHDITELEGHYHIISIIPFAQKNAVIVLWEQI